ncbi:microcystin-dependent protein [Aquabacter spiritensis]|uniref:Microcystin-dependent protein n=2 Tax=Aquabacter spiritensis TaxID=933073 RepID=A0A4V2UYN0_9HYPH|nr:microcystin-dependent protein [Aquabacter spiritensis]
MIDDAFIGEIRFLPYRHKNPQGWLPCEGQSLPTSQYQALYAVIGDRFSSGGGFYFAVPDLRGRTPVGVGVSASAGPVTLGERIGVETVVLAPEELPKHNHTIRAKSAGYSGNESAFKSAPSGTVWPGRYLDNTTGALGTINAYLNAPDFETEAMDPRTLGATGGSGAHENRQPYLTLAPYICYYGIFPSPDGTPPPSGGVAVVSE